MSMIKTTNLTRHFGPTTAVHGLSFEIGEHTLAALLGPNGAGKSTTIRMLTATLPPSSGTAVVAGHDVREDSLDVRRCIGYLPESTPLYPELTVSEYLHFRGRLMDMARRDRMARIDALLDICGLKALRRRTIGRLSKGNRQRLGIAQALLHEPEVLILDEPTSSLDPSQVANLRSLLQNLKEHHTILLSSHILPEVEQIADQFLVMNRGSLVAQGSASDLQDQSASHPRVRVEAKCDETQLRRIALALGSLNIEQIHHHDGWSRAVLSSTEANLPLRISDALRREEIALRELAPIEPSLEELFVRLTSGLIESPAALRVGDEDEAVL